MNKNMEMKYHISELVQFKSSKDYYGCFGNMSGGNRIDICGYNLHGSEILYQCLKYTNKPHIQEKLIQINHPLKAKWHQKNYVKQGLVDDGFEENKIGIMKLCLLFKYKSSYENNTDFHRLLLSTNKENIIEVSKNDFFWGTKPDGEYLIGKNMLGKCLMWLRDSVNNSNEISELFQALENEYPYLNTLKLVGKSLGETATKHNMQLHQNINPVLY